MRRFAPLLLAMLIASLLPSTPAASAPAHLTKTNTTSIHILGSFNGWNTALWTTDPGMTPDGTTWRDTVAIESWAVEQGYEQFKFVTDRAYDVPPDYCLCPDRVADYRALSGPVCAISGGLNVQMYADVPGQYAFTLDEAALTYSASLVQPFDATITGTVSIPGTSSPPVATVMLTKPGSPVASARALTDPATGRFSASRLDAGTYNLLVTAPGFPGGTANGVVVVPGGVTDAGTITLSGCTSQLRRQMCPNGIMSPSGQCPGAPWPNQAPDKSKLRLSECQLSQKSGEMRQRLANCLTCGAALTGVAPGERLKTIERPEFFSAVESSSS